MTRSDKVNPREDEQRRHELSGLLQGTPIESRDDGHVQEADARIEPGRRPETGEPGPDGRSIDDAMDLAEFSRWFERSWFPTSGRDLGERAAERGAPGWLQRTLIAYDRVSFESITALWEAIRGSMGDGARAVDPWDD